MSSNAHCPSCGGPLPEPKAAPTISHSLTHCNEPAGNSPTPPEPAPPVVPEVPRTTPVVADSNTSPDMPTLRDLGPAEEPDPLLGEFVPSAIQARSKPSALEDPDEFEIPASLSQGPDSVDDAPPLLGIDTTRTAPKKPTLQSESMELDPPGPRRIPTAVVLLASYASAMTLAAGWLIYDRRRSTTEEAEPATVARSDIEPTGRAAREVAAAESIPESRTTEVGRAIRAGSLEILPLKVERKNVQLIRRSTGLTGGSGSDRPRDGGSAWLLTLRLKNLADSTAFAPLEEAYLREGERSPTDSYIETPSGDRVYLYPLAVESEWKIRGQDFRELRPREQVDTIIASEPAPPAVKGGDLRWRVRLSTGSGRAETFVVRSPIP